MNIVTLRGKNKKSSERERKMEQSLTSGTLLDNKLSFEADTNAGQGKALQHFFFEGNSAV